MFTSRTKELITSLGQEMAQLTGKLTASELDSVSLSHKVALLKLVKLVTVFNSVYSLNDGTCSLLREAAEKQTSLHQLHVSKLVSALSSFNDKVMSG